jgi:hypothetical protein
MDDDAQRSANGDEILARDTLNGAEVVRTNEGWFFSDTQIRVPGGEDRTLASEFEDQIRIQGPVTGPDDEAVISAALVDEHPEILGWCKGAASSLQTAPSGEVAGYVIPIDVWRKRSDERLGIAAPQISGIDAERALAEAEHGFRLERKQYLEANERRIAALRSAIAAGVTRARAADILDISAARVSQLVAPASAKLDTTHLATLATISSHGGSVTPEELAALGKTTRFVTESVDTAQAMLFRLAAGGFVQHTPEGPFQLTAEGRSRATKWRSAQAAKAAKAKAKKKKKK